MNSCLVPVCLLPDLTRQPFTVMSPARAGTMLPLNGLSAIKSEGWVLGNMNSTYCTILVHRFFRIHLFPYLSKNSDFFSMGKFQIVEIRWLPITSDVLVRIVVQANGLRVTKKLDKVLFVLIT